MMAEKAAHLDRMIQARREEPATSRTRKAGWALGCHLLVLLERVVRLDHLLQAHREEPATSRTRTVGSTLGYCLLVLVG